MFLNKIVIPFTVTTMSSICIDKLKLTHNQAVNDKKRLIYLSNRRAPEVIRDPEGRDISVLGNRDKINQGIRRYKSV
jgi:hypothetical protein